MYLSQRIYRCAFYTRGVVLTSRAVGRPPPQRPYHRSATLLSSDDAGGSERGEGRGRGAQGGPVVTRKTTAGWKPPGAGAGGWKDAKQRRPAKAEYPGKKQAGAGAGLGAAGLRPQSRLPADLRRLRQDDVDDDDEEAEPEPAPSGRPDTGAVGRTEMLFGAAPCLLALSQGRRKLHRLFVKGEGATWRPALQQACDEARRRSVPVEQGSRRHLDKLCEGRVHQGLCLEASPLGYLADDGHDAGPARDPQEGGPPPLWLVLEEVQDPMNLGAILRSAYFLGVDRIMSSVHNSCPLTPVVSKASSGVMEVAGVYGYRNLADMLKLKARQGWQIIGSVGAAEEEGAKAPVLDCSDFTLTAPTLLLIGGEGTGLSPELQGFCHALLTIPPCRELHPAIESLNVSVATGILIHSLLSSRGRGR